MITICAIYRLFDECKSLGSQSRYSLYHVFSSYCFYDCRRENGRCFDEINMVYLIRIIIIRLTAVGENYHFNENPYTGRLHLLTVMSSCHTLFIHNRDKLLGTAKTLIDGSRIAHNMFSWLNAVANFDRSDIYIYIYIWIHTYILCIVYRIKLLNYENMVC